MAAPPTGQYVLWSDTWVPRLPLGFQGHALLLQAAPGDRELLTVPWWTSWSHRSSLFCFSVNQDNVNGTYKEEIQRLLLSVLKPEQVMEEDVSKPRNELQRKDTLVQKHFRKLSPRQQDTHMQNKKSLQYLRAPWLT
ncbi:mediator of RNA polymerase II transcription subunit 28-like [Sciurus carolinensis]|uniref:mediator of RNA polymerase II transcription subunit 28-like n=1 Tax=Sciurus carolinensis TaxID=30640 RepID=UPI001FB282D1|nr:mediator of RNA polymerase II transcription subunit 28-like [Sciurus carolinensis]